MSKVLEIFYSAYATSRHNIPGESVVEEGEFIDVLNSSLRGYMAEGAEVNPAFFGVRFVASKLDEAGGWHRPPRAAMILRLEAGEGALSASGESIPIGTEIVQVPYDQRNIEGGRPAVYNFGQVFYPAGKQIDPEAGDLVIMASRLPESLTKLDDQIDPTWPEAFNSLLKWDLAIYLAVKDGDRDTEVAAFMGQREQELARYKSFLANESVALTRDFGHNRVGSV